MELTDEQIRGKTDHDIFPLDLADRLRKNDQLVIATRSPVEVEEMVRGSRLSLSRSNDMRAGESASPA